MKEVSSQTGIVHIPPREPKKTNVTEEQIENEVGVEKNELVIYAESYPKPNFGQS